MRHKNLEHSGGKIGRYTFLLLFLSVSTITCCDDNDADNAYSMTNQNFVTLASANYNFETAAGALAEGRAESDEVSAYGKRMVSGYTAASMHLTNTASQKGFSVESNLQEPLKSNFATLTGLSGAAFDKEFIRVMVLSHQDAIALFGNASKTMGIADADLRAMAVDKLPSLKAELQDALAIQALD